MNTTDPKRGTWLKMAAPIALTMTLAALLACPVRADEPGRAVAAETGICYFTWDTYVCRDGNVIGMSPEPKVAYVPNPRQEGYTHPTPATPAQLIAARALWMMAAQVNRKVQQLTPSILSPTVATETFDYSVGVGLGRTEHPIRCLLKPHGKGRSATAPRSSATRLHGPWPGRKGTRLVNRAVSKDFIHWTDEGPITFPEGEGPQFLAQYYVNQIKPYDRAPHLYIGFPARYVDHGLTPSTKQLPEWELREKRMTVTPRYGTAFTDSVFITSRDGRNSRSTSPPVPPERCRSPSRAPTVRPFPDSVAKTAT